MNVNAASMFNELQLEKVQAKNIDTSETVKISNPTNTAPANFSAMLKQAIENVNGLQQNTTELRNGYEMGDKNISLSDVMIAANKSSLAFDATVQVRNKMVEAYKEVMSMPV
jgi:flagellar hook-basal body complex protein FliE